MLESLFNKVAGLQTCNVIEKRLQHRGFSVKFMKFLRTPKFTEHLRWLILCDCTEQRRIQNPVKHLRWNFLRKDSTAESKFWNIIGRRGEQTLLPFTQASFFMIFDYQ